MPTPGDPHLSSLTRDLAHLQYERAQAERAGDAEESAAITDAIKETKREIATLTHDPEIARSFQEFRRRQFDLVSKVHDIQRTEDQVHVLKDQEHTLARKHSDRTSSSYTLRTLQSLRSQQASLRTEITTLLSADPELALAWRSWQLREYRNQLRKDHFVETPSRTALGERITDLWADGKKILCTGPTGTGKTELVKHAARHYSGEPEIISGHQGLTPYEVYGKPTLTAKDGIPISSFQPGKLTRAAENGHICIYDEVDLIPTQTLLRHKADFNLHVGDSLHIQEDSAQSYQITQGFGIAATANIKGKKHKEREALDPAFTRLFEPLPVAYFPSHELYDLSLASLIDRRGFLNLSHDDAAETLKHLVDAAVNIQEAYLGNPTQFYEKGGGSASKHAFLEKAVLDPGRLLNLLKGWPRAFLKGQTFHEFLATELLHFVNNEDYAHKDRFTLLDILTTHGFLHGHSIKDFLPSNFTPEEWQRHLQAHPLPNSVGQRTLSEPKGPLDPLTVAALDPYNQRGISVSSAAAEFLAAASPLTSDVIDTTDCERTLNLSTQYTAQCQILRDSKILQSLPRGKEGITGIDNHPYPVPTLSEIRSALTAEPHLREKIAQGFTRLLIIPFGMSLDALRERYKETLLKTDQSRGLKNAAGNAVTLDRNDPLYTWDTYEGADVDGKLIYDLQQFNERHFGKTKTEILATTGGPARRSLGEGGWQVLLVEEMDELPRAGQGRTLGGRTQLECGKTPTDYINTLRNAAGQYAHEVGLTPESYIILAITRLKEQGIVIDHDTLSYLLGGYFHSAGYVPNGYFYPDYHQAVLDWNVPGRANARSGGRPAVRVI